MAALALPILKVDTSPRYGNATFSKTHGLRLAERKPPSIAAKINIPHDVIMENMPLVRSIAKRVRRSLPANIEYDDLVNAGVLGLIDALAKFNPNKDVDFSSYAHHRIRGAMVDSLRDLDWASRDLRRKDKQIQRATRDLSAELERPPSDLELADRMGVKLDRCRQILSKIHSCGLISTDSKGSDDTPPVNLIGNKDSRPDEICRAWERQSKVAKALRGLPIRYRQVLTLYYSDDLTMKQIGCELGVNESRISQIHKLALAKMEIALQGIGVRSIYDLVA